MNEKDFVKQWVLSEASKLAEIDVEECVRRNWLKHWISDAIQLYDAAGREYNRQKLGE